MTDISRLAQKARRYIYFSLYWSRIGTGPKEQTRWPRHPKSQTRSYGELSLTVVAMLAPVAVTQHWKQPGEERVYLAHRPIRRKSQWGLQSRNWRETTEGCCLLGCFRIPFLHLFPGPAQGYTTPAGWDLLYLSTIKKTAHMSVWRRRFCNWGSFFPGKSSFVSGWQKLTHK